MKFTIDGREYEDYQLSNEQIVELLEGDHEVTDMGHDFLMKKVYERFKYECCAKNGETNDDVFARQFSNYVNGKLNSRLKVAEKMASDHRYLQSEMFHVCLEYIKMLASAYKRGWYDGRNEYACMTSKLMIDHLTDIKHPY